MEWVIFACVHNAGRSQMAGAFFAEMVDQARAEAIIAGTQPGEHVHPTVVEVMRELGIDLSGKRPQRLTDALFNKGLVQVGKDATFFGELDLPIRFKQDARGKGFTSVALALVVGLGF